MRQNAPVSGAISSAHWRIELARVARLRYVVLAALAVACSVVSGGRGDWDVFVSAGRSLLGSEGLSVYTLRPDVQTGPVSLVLARVLAITPRNGFVACVIVCAVLGLVAIRCLEKAQRPDRTVQNHAATFTTLLGGTVVVFWWAKLGGYGHLDDALVLTSAAAALLCVRRGRAVLAAVLIGVAIATKPWAVILVPLTFGTAGPLWKRLQPPLISCVVGGCLWLPFFIAEPNTLRALKPTVSVAPDSVLELFGLADSSIPGWLRIAQLLGALALAALVVWRGRFGGVLLAAVAVRMITDPGTWSYYTAGFMLGALAWDLYETNSITPKATWCAAVLLLPPWLIPWDDVRAITRLVACLAAVVLVMAERTSTVRSSFTNA